MLFYSYMSIRLHSILCQDSIIACLRLNVAVLEDLQKGVGLDSHEPAVHMPPSCASKWK